MAKSHDIKALLNLARTMQILLSKYQSSLLPPKSSKTYDAVSSSSQAHSSDLRDPISVIKATTSLLRSHTTTLSLLLINPPLTPSALISKIQDVSSSVLGGMVAAALYTPSIGQADEVGKIMRKEIKSQVWRLLGTWSDILGLVIRRAEEMPHATRCGKDMGLGETEKQNVLAATGVVWNSCDALVRLCDEGIVALIVEKAEEYRATLLDALCELKEWGEDVQEEENDNDDDDDDKAISSDAGCMQDEDDFFGTEKKLGKDDVEMRKLLEQSIKKVKMMGILYQAVVKRRLKTYPLPNTTTNTSSANANSPSSMAMDTSMTPAVKLDRLMTLLETIPGVVDDLASTFYDLNASEARSTLEQCCGKAKNVIDLMKESWDGKEDEFSEWGNKWMSALDAA